MGLKNQPSDLPDRLEAAREKLENRDLPGAMALYEEILAIGGDSGDVLAAVSGELGSAGQMAPIIELIAPLYDPERHGPAAGLNLLQAYLLLRDAEAAQHMLDLLLALGRPELEERLQGFSNAIAELGATETESGLSETPAAPGGRPAPAAAQGTAVSISKPIWFYGLEPLAPQILPPKQGKLRRVAFTQLALPGFYADLAAARKMPEDEPARLSRALPLWLADIFYFSPRYAPIAAIAIMTETDGARSPAILGTEWTTENLRQLIATTKDGLDYIFDGVLRRRDGGYELTLRVWEVKKLRERHSFSAQWTAATADAELGRLRDALCQYMEWIPYDGAEGLSSPAPAALLPWLDALGASLGLFLAEKNILAKELIAPLGPIFEALQPLAANEPIPALAWLTARARAKALGLEPGAQAEATALADRPVVAAAREALGL